MFSLDASNLKDFKSADIRAVLSRTAPRATTLLTLNNVKTLKGGALKKVLTFDPSQNNVTSLLVEGSAYLVINTKANAGGEVWGKLVKGRATPISLPSNDTNTTYYDPEAWDEVWSGWENALALFNAIWTVSARANLPKIDVRSFVPLCDISYMRLRSAPASHRAGPSDTRSYP